MWFAVRHFLATALFVQIRYVSAQIPPIGLVSIGSIGVDFASNLDNLLGGLLGGLTGLTGGLTGGLTSALGSSWDPSDSFVKQGGTGCKKGTVGAVLAQDYSFMTLIFDDFKATIGPKVSAAQQRSFCRVLVKVVTPAGYQFNIQSADYRGYYSLDKGITASIVASYVYLGDLLPKTNQIVTTVQGPVSDDFLLQQKGVSSSSLFPRPCSLNTTTYIQMSLSAALTASNRSASGLLETDSTDGSFQQVLGLGWKKC